MVRRHARGRHRPDNRRHDIGVGELGRGQVDSQPELEIWVGLLPLNGLPASLLDDPSTDGRYDATLLGERHKLGRAEETARRVLPADQCLDADDLTVEQVDDRLIVDAQLTGTDGPAQILLDLHPVQDLGAHGRLVHDDP